MADTSGTRATTPTRTQARPMVLWRLLRRDPLALASAVFLALLILCALIGPWLIGDLANKVSLRQRNLPPGSLEFGVAYFL